MFSRKTELKPTDYPDTKYDNPHKESGSPKHSYFCSFLEILLIILTIVDTCIAIFVGILAARNDHGLLGPDWLVVLVIFGLPTTIVTIGVWLTYRHFSSQINT